MGSLLFLLSYMAINHVLDENLCSGFLLVLADLGPLNEEVVKLNKWLGWVLLLDQRAANFRCLTLMPLLNRTGLDLLLLLCLDPF